MTTTPITTDGSAVCTNLNADMLDGKHLSDILAEVGTNPGSVPLTGGTMTGQLVVAPAWNDASTTFTAVKANAADANSAADSKLLDLQVNGVSKLTVTKDGTLTTASIARATNLNADMIDGLHLTDLDGRFGVAAGSLPLTGGSLTGALAVAPADPAVTSALVVSPTWDNSATAYTGAKINVTDTASASASKLLDCQVGGIPKFSVAKDGTLATASTSVVTNLNADAIDGKHLADLDSRYVVAPSTSGALVTNLNADLLDGQHGSYYAAYTDWTNWTPTITQGGSVAITITEAKYCFIGKVCHIYGYLTVTGSGIGGNVIVIGGQPTAVQPARTNIPIGTAYLIDAGVGYYMGNVIDVSATGWQIMVGSTNSVAGVIPNYALANGDLIMFSATYRVA
jgi:hypothetical protein